MFGDEIFIFLFFIFFIVGLIMDVSTVKLKNCCSGEGCFKRTFFASGAEYIYLLITGTVWHTLICNLMEILNEEAAHISGHASVSCS